MTFPVYRLSLFKRIIAKVLTFLLNTWGRSLRIKLTDRAKVIVEQYALERKICVLWHNRLGVAAPFFQKYFSKIPMYGLISPSRDGAWLAEVYKNLGIRAIRGSSKRRGYNAMMKLEDVLNGQHSVAITPDGPRGPRYIAKPGIAKIAKLSQAPIIVAGVEYKKFWRVSSWDKFFIPYPFSRVNIDLLVILPKNYSECSEAQILEMVQNYLVELNKITQLD